jgi:hypothetical protein
MTRAVTHLLLVAAALVIGAAVLLAGLRSGAPDALALTATAVGVTGLTWGALVLALPRSTGGSRGARR